MKQLEIGDKIYECTRRGRIVGLYEISRTTAKRAYFSVNGFETTIDRESETDYFRAVGQRRKFQLVDAAAMAALAAQNRRDDIANAIAVFDPDLAAESADAGVLLALLRKYRMK